MPWMILTTAVPFALALAVLQLLGPKAGPEIGVASQTGGYLPGLIAFCTAALAQFAICIGAIFVFLQVLRGAPLEIRRLGLKIGIPFAAFMLLALALMPKFGGAAGELTFAYFAATFANSGPEWLVAAGPGGALTRLQLAYYLPSALGVLAVVSAAVALSALVKAMPEPDAPEWPAAWQRSHVSARQILYLLTLILVLSTFAASLFFHLPVELFHGDAKKAMLRFANELSIFWGTVYTLTLVATVTPAVFLLRNRAHKAVRNLTDPEAAKEAKALLESQGLLAGMKQQVELVLALLAPMIAGPLANALQAAVVA